MEYASRVPGPPLNRLIDDIYCLSGTPRCPRLNVPPMPSAHLMINLGGPVRLYDSDPAVPPAMLCDGWFMGLWSRRFAIEHQAPVRVIGVHFKPWGMSPFVGVPMTEMRDRWVPSEAVWGPAFHRLRDRIGSATSTAGMLGIVEVALRARLLATRTSDGLQVVDHTARRIEATWGATSVGTLGDGLGVSGNYLAAQFKMHLGLTPKPVARIYRFAHLILSIDGRHHVDWSRLAQEAGYFDQAHLGKEFKAFTGHTPSDYLALRRRHPAQEGFPPDNGPIPIE